MHHIYQCDPETKKAIIFPLYNKQKMQLIYWIQHILHIVGADVLQVVFYSLLNMSRLSIYINVYQQIQLWQKYNTVDHIGTVVNFTQVMQNILLYRVLTVV